MNKTIAKNIRSEVQALLNEVGAKYGTSLKMGNIKFSPTDGTIRFPVKGQEGEDENPDLAYETDFNNKFKSKTCLGDEFTVAGKKYTFIGTKSSRTKYPVIGRSLNARTEGKLYAFAKGALFYGLEKA